MSNLNHADIVKQQYATETNLNTRIAIHEKYSTNKVGLWNISPSCFLGMVWMRAQTKISHFKMEAIYEVNFSQRLKS